MVGPPSLRNEPASLLPGGITYVADPSGQSFRPAMEVRIDLSHLGQDIAEVQGRIKQAFYADLFLMMAESDRREITAREIDEPYFPVCGAFMLVKIALITSPARIGGRAAMPRKIAVARRQ